MQSVLHLQIARKYKIAKGKSETESLSFIEIYIQYVLLWGTLRYSMRLMTIKYQ